MIRTGVVYFLAMSCFVGYASNSKSDTVANNNGQTKPPGIQSNSSQQSTKITIEELIRKIKDFARLNKSILETNYKDMRTVSGRIITGFQQIPPAKIQLADGITILWGWKHHEPYFMSIAIFDSHNTLKMAGFADNLPHIYSTSVFGNTMITNMAEYEALQKRTSLPPPIVKLYAATQKDADTYYPLAARWVQVAMMGFYTKCSDPKQSASCRFVETIQIPTYIFTRNCPYKDEWSPKCILDLPSATSKAVPSLDDFR